MPITHLASLLICTPIKSNVLHAATTIKINKKHMLPYFQNTTKFLLIMQTQYQNNILHGFNSSVTSRLCRHRCSAFICNVEVINIGSAGQSGFTINSCKNTNKISMVFDKAKSRSETKLSFLKTNRIKNTLWVCA